VYLERLLVITAGGFCSFDVFAGGLWSQRLKQYLLNNGIAIVEANVRSQSINQSVNQSINDRTLSSSRTRADGHEQPKQRQDKQEACLPKDRGRHFRLD
jgi:hypothetical protein